MVVEDQRRALGEVQLVGQREGEELRRDRHLGEAAEHAEGGDAIAGRTAAPSGALRTTPADLAARHERQRRLELVLAAGLQHLGERDAGGVDVDHDAAARCQRMRRLGLGQSTSASAESGPLNSMIWMAFTPGTLHWHRALDVTVVTVRLRRGRRTAAALSAKDGLTRVYRPPGGSIMPSYEELQRRHVAEAMAMALPGQVERLSWTEEQLAAHRRDAAAATGADGAGPVPCGIGAGWPESTRTPSTSRTWPRSSGDDQRGSHGQLRRDPHRPEL